MMGQGPEYIMSQQQQQHPGYYTQYQMGHPNQLPPMNQMNPPGQGQNQGFMLHGQPQPQSLPPNSNQPGMYQNGQNYYSPEHQYRGFQTPPQGYQQTG